MFFNFLKRIKFKPKQNNNFDKNHDNSSNTIESTSSLDIDRLYQKGLIITDDISIDPILDFSLYRDAIVNIIRNSYPKFTIGIFGDWGTGKTTLMNSIDQSLGEIDKNIVRVRFETWRYEREDQFALVPLLKTIAFALPDDETFRPLKEKLKRGAVNFLKKTPEILSSLISKYINEDVGTISQKAFDEFKKEFNSKMELLNEIDRDTLYFDGFDMIREDIKSIQNNNPNFKIVVFIDDLDRCSPKKTLEVLESIKVFLGMEGFVYIIGLSHDIVTKLIDIEYKEKGVKGEQYIKKIIQIPITLPDWNKTDIKNLIEDFISKKIIVNKYHDILKENIDYIVTAVEENPRETKRFLNNFIVAFEIYSRGGAQLQELLILQTLNMRWNEIYKLLINSDGSYFKKLEVYIKNITELKKLDPESKDIDSEDMILIKYLRDQDLWEFLKNNYHVINSIQNWNLYRRATKVSQDPTTAYKSLSEGKVNNYNIHSIVVTPDNTKVLVGSAYPIIKVWDIASGKLLTTLLGHQATIGYLAVTPDSKKIVSGSWDGTIKVWDIASGMLLYTFTFVITEFIPIAVTPDNTKIVVGSGGDRTIKVWDLSSGILLNTLLDKSETASITVTPDSKKIVSGTWDGTIEVWDIASGVLLNTLTGHGTTVYGIAVTPDNTKIVSGSGDRTIKVWDLSSGGLLTTLTSSVDYPIYAIAITSDNTKIISGTNCAIEVWDIASGGLLTTLSGESFLNTLAVTSDNTKIISGYQNIIQVWDIASGRLLSNISNG